MFVFDTPSSGASSAAKVSLILLRFSYLWIMIFEDGWDGTGSERRARKGIYGKGDYEMR